MTKNDSSQHTESSRASRSSKRGRSKNGWVQLTVDVLDPSPKGHALSDEAAPQMAYDLARIALFCELSPKGHVVIHDEKKPIVVNRHRVVLTVASSELTVLLGHVSAYAKTVLAGHAVLVTVNTVLHIA